ncbi:MAG: hypothetical protein V5A64_01335 [Candidatus Thermoplasmatota archaeon]
MIQKSFLFGNLGKKDICIRSWLYSCEKGINNLTALSLTTWGLIK